MGQKLNYSSGKLHTQIVWQLRVQQWQTTVNWPSKNTDNSHCFQYNYYVMEETTGQLYAIHTVYIQILNKNKS